MVSHSGVIARVSSPKVATALSAFKGPVVNVSGIVLKESSFPRVAVDLEAAAELALVHFTDRALPHFAYIGPLHLDYVSQHERAFERVLSATGRVCHVFPADTSLSPDTSWRTIGSRRGHRLIRTRYQQR